MPDVQPRDLRRTFGSWIVQETWSLKVAQDLLPAKPGDKWRGVPREDAA